MTDPADREGPGARPECAAAVDSGTLISGHLQPKGGHHDVRQVSRLLLPGLGTKSEGQLSPRDKARQRTKRRKMMAMPVCCKIPRPGDLFRPAWALLQMKHAHEGLELSITRGILEAFAKKRLRALEGKIFHKWYTRRPCSGRDKLYTPPTDQRSGEVDCGSGEPKLRSARGLCS